MATYNQAAILSTKALLQPDNDSWECLPKYEIDRKPAYTASTFSAAPTVDVVPSGLEKLKARLVSAKEARDRRVSLYEAWQRKLPTEYAKQTYPTVESYPPHRAQFAREQQHQSWYPHYKSSGNVSCVEPDASKVEDLKKETRHQSWYPHCQPSSNDSDVKLDASKVADLTKETRHQSWYPHYKAPSTTSDNSSAELEASETESVTEQTQHQSWYPHYKSSSASSNDSVDTLVVEDLKKERSHQSWYPHYTSSSDDSCAKPDASTVEDLKKQKHHQSWYPHYKTSSSGADVAASKLGSLKNRVVFRVSRITDSGIDRT